MGIWDYISPATDFLKRKTPDLTPVKSVWRSSYGYGWAAVSKVDEAVRVNAVEKWNHLRLPDEETRSKIVRITSNLAKNTAVFACQEGLKSVPGGMAVYNIVGRSIRDDKKSEDHNIKMKARVEKLESELSVCRKLLEEQTRIDRKPDLELKSQKPLYFDSNVDHKPEDLIRIFMMKEFMGSHLLDDLIVSGTRSRKKPN